MSAVKKYCEGCKHILGDGLHCLGCSRNKEDRFEPIVLKEGQCRCIYCKRIFDTKENKRIFASLEDPSKGICFDCY